ncbi:hypothetical protein EDB81DRAFT_850589 [Dactylonectria macrodidyma]|uniref:Uncharacterized protein n=1 Tax=Dactylonectria macrodidyma TaxID=307937 RepID=A0A9P9JJJ5_9HYPO|nr:hypothetical protein EDB81DRAFT_850589 [Dactylonectria macrodidyma]
MSVELTDLIPIAPANDDLRLTLASALGLSDNVAAKPHLQYIESSWPGRGELHDFLRLFIDVVDHFRGPKPPIQQYIDRLVSSHEHSYFSDTIPGSSLRTTRVTEAVLIILGTWMLMQPYFILTRHDQRRVVFAYCAKQGREYSEAEAFAQPLPKLLSQSGLLPNAYELNESGLNSVQNSSVAEIITEPFGLHDSMGLLESLSLSPKRLNAVLLSRLGGVRVTWTTNISRHLLLSKHGERTYLELFALPCALQGDAGSVLSAMGISMDLIDEIECSYATLFNPSRPSNFHKRLTKLKGFCHWCWCLHCASYRLRRQLLGTLKLSHLNYDPTLETLMERDAAEWDQTEFKQLWPRISTLYSHMQQTKPWSFWVLFRDSRDTVQYWTFLFGTVILLLTVIQVILSAAQVASAFVPQPGG